MERLVFCRRIHAKCFGRAVDVHQRQDPSGGCAGDSSATDFTRHEVVADHDVERWTAIREKSRYASARPVHPSAVEYHSHADFITGSCDNLGFQSLLIE